MHGANKILVNILLGLVIAVIAGISTNLAHGAVVTTAEAAPSVMVLAD